MVSAMTKGTYLAIILLFSIAFAAEAQLVLGQGVGSEEASRLILNVYLDGTGKALVTGYVENPKGLAFLNSSQYNYENETHQLYALTNALTRKDGDTWTLNFESSGYYEDYRATFYMPSDFQVKNISSSQGLEHLLSASNDSLALDFQGYDVLDPVAGIEYQQPLEAVAPPNPGSSYVVARGLLPLLVILVVGSAAALLWRYKAKRPQGPSQGSWQGPGQSASGIEGAVIASAVTQESAGPDKEVISTESSKPEETASVGGAEAGEKASSADISPEKIETSGGMDAATETSAKNPASSDQAQPYEYISSESQEPEEPGDKDESRTGTEAQASRSSAEKIEISSEMAAVMETLTPRERAILQALIDRGGRSTQADLRYETRTPKSSLTGIIYSLERRKLVIKKEWGRTNVIELSEWFLSKKEQF